MTPSLKTGLKADIATQSVHCTVKLQVLKIRKFKVLKCTQCLSFVQTQADCEMILIQEVYLAEALTV